MSRNTRRCVAVDLDGTLAHYDRWRGVDQIGKPIPEMVERVRRWLAAGDEVVIFTARVAACHGGRDRAAAVAAIEAWCELHLGRRLLVTAEKLARVSEIWDDRAVSVEPNTGRWFSMRGVPT